MDKHEYRTKTEEMLQFMRNKSYKQAMDIADVIDWRKVKNVSMLCAVSEIYEYNGEYEKSRDILFLAYDRSPDSRKIIYRLGTLALKLGEIKEASDCYDEFIAIAPRDPNQYIFKYKILKAKKAPISQQIDALEEFKKVEYVEKWAFELAKLYHAAGMTAECLEECDDLILWFSEGKYVYKAMDLKMKYKPLTPLQQEKYSRREMAPVETKEEPVKEESVVEEAAEEEPVKESVEEEAVEEVAVEEPVEEEAVEEAAVEEPVEEETAGEEPVVEERPAQQLSIEEMLQSWETRQKENAQIIRAEVEKAELEKAQEEEQKEETVEESILPDDIRKLMEELESESADIEAKKVKQDTEPEEIPVQEAAVEEKEELPVVEEIVSEVVEEPVVENPLYDDKELEEALSHEYDAPKAEEGPGIRLGDTQSMSMVAKALKNNVEVTMPEDEAVEEKPVRKNPYDTGFIVQGRYDLEAQSEIGLKAGLTEEQKKLFSYFVPVHGMSEQIVEVLQSDKKCRARYGTSRIGNLLIIGRKGSGKTVLAVDIVKAIQKQRKLKQGKVGIVTADSLNKKNVEEILEKLHGGAIIIEKASYLSRRSIEDMCEVMEGQTGELLVVLEDERKPLERMLEQYPQFKKKFTSRLELPVFINDELVTFGQTYAKENGYKIDEMGILALYSRIDMLQRDEHAVTVADVKDILDEAIENSQRASFKKLMKKVLGKNKDNSERILLREEDFR